MKLGMVGLGRMGGNMAERLLRAGHQVVGFDLDAGIAAALGARGARIADTPEGAVRLLQPPRALWIMVPAGAPVAAVINLLLPHLSPGDILIDGGNSNYKDSISRAAALRDHGIHLLDVGTSGGIWGLENGYCLMIGGERRAFQRLEPVFASLAQPGGYAHIGPSGAGHYAKMIPNGIEYGIMQAIGEGFAILEASRFQYDLAALADLWGHGSVIRSWLLELAARAFRANPTLEGVGARVADSGEGRWTVQEAIDLDVPAPVITQSLLARLQSRNPDSFSAKTLAALRKEFGGHPVTAVQD
jgi:6-phosphogluconate dehydrogenase